MKAYEKSVNLSFQACEQKRMRNKARTDLEVRGMKVGQILQLPRGSAQCSASPEQLPPRTCAPLSEASKGGADGDSRRSCVSC